MQKAKRQKKKKHKSYLDVCMHMCSFFSLSNCWAQPFGPLKAFWLQWEGGSHIFNGGFLSFFLFFSVWSSSSSCRPEPIVNYKAAHELAAHPPGLASCFSFPQ